MEVAKSRGWWDAVAMGTEHRVWCVVFYDSFGAECEYILHHFNLLARCKQALQASLMCGDVKC